MPKLFLTPFVIAGLLFLPSCSSAEAKACKDAEQARAEFIEAANNYYTQYEKGIDGNLYSQAEEQYINAQRVVINNPSCFTPTEVAEAQTNLSKLK